MTPLVTLLTDFGTADGYVAEMKGVILAAAPGATVLDVTHEIPPHDVDAGRLALARYWRRFPSGTVHLAVVDPGVGTSRHALAVASGGHAFVGPDNGILTPALLSGHAEVVTLPVPASAAPTFHGRDVFAPAAAALARGEPASALGEPFEDPVVRRTPEPRRLENGAIAGEIIAIDRFGNAITNLVGVRGGTVEVGGVALPMARTYGDVASGDLTALCGSNGLIELAVRDGSAARLHGIRRGAQVLFRPATG